MTHMPSLKPLCLLHEHQVSWHHRRVICSSQRNNVPSIKIAVPPFKSARFRQILGGGGVSGERGGGRLRDYLGGGGAKYFCWGRNSWRVLENPQTVENERPRWHVPLAEARAESQEPQENTPKNNENIRSQMLFFFGILGVFFRYFRVLGSNSGSPGSPEFRAGGAFVSGISGLQKGPAERGHIKKRQKSSKSVKKFFDTFRQFSRRAKNVKNRQKASKSFSTLFDNFRAAPL